MVPLPVHSAIMTQGGTMGVSHVCVPGGGGGGAPSALRYRSNLVAHGGGALSALSALEGLTR